MKKVKWLERLQQKWNLNSVSQVLIVLLVFACTGITVMLIKKPILHFLAGESGDTLLASIIYYIFILPLYNVLLLAYGFVFGHFAFFWDFEMRFVKRVLNKLDKNKQP